MVHVKATREMVLTKLEHCFSHEDIRSYVLELLDQYGASSDNDGRARVQLAILKLSAGKFRSVATFVQVAKTDFRDVLGLAEYPEEMNAGAEDKRDPKACEAIRQRDREQYLTWLNGTSCEDPAKYIW